MNATAIGGELVGRVIDARFTLVQYLGSFQGAEVFLTDFGDPPQKCALKLIPADHQDAVLRVEAWQAAAKLSHPNLMKVFAAGRCKVDSLPFFYVVEECADEVLAEIIPQRALTPEEAREMLGPALDALSYLHGKGFVHGRLKPSNIMAVGDRLKLSADGLTVTGAFAKPSSERTVYDAPETAQGSFGPAADVWSLGATLVEVLTQHPPIWDGTATSEPVVPETVPQPFAAVARQCLHDDPRRRCTLDQIKRGLAPHADRPHKADQLHTEDQAGKSSKTRLRLVVSIFAVVAVVAVFAIWRAQSHHEETPAPAADQPNSQAVAPFAQNPPAPSAASSNSSSAPASGSDSAASAPQASAPQASAPAAPSAHAPPAASIQSGGATEKGAVAQQVQPDVLASAMRTISGTLKTAVRVSVDASGNVTSAEFESAGPSKYFANKALDAARHWTFKPAQVDGQPAASTWILHFEFRRNGVNIAPVETAP